MPTEAPSRPPASAAGAAGSEDVRRSRVYLLSRGPLLGLVRRALSIGALVLADVAGLALGVYVALVLRALVYGDTIYWSLRGDRPGRMAAIPRSRNRPRLPPGRALRAA